MLISTLYWQEYLFIAIVGLSIGSLLNVIIYRLPIIIQRDNDKAINDYLCQHLSDTDKSANHHGISKQRFNLFLPNSHCPSCKRTIHYFDNIPLISWLLLKGKCRHCKVKIGWRYPLIELVMMLIALLLAWRCQTVTQCCFALVFMALLLTAAMIDLDHFILPDSLTYLLLWLGLLSHGILNDIALYDAVIGVVVGYLCLAAICLGSKAITGKECLGYGDPKLLSALGAWFGWQAIPTLVLIASSLSIIFVLCWFGGIEKARGKPIAFGPGLAFAGAILFIATI